jgi:molybdopterin molybdotransferase
MAGLLSYDDARAAVLRACRATEMEEVPLAEAHGRVLAVAPVSRDAIPPFSNSAMDGFAVRAVEVTPGVPMPLAGGTPTGFVPDPLPIGHAMRVGTGGAIPPGADAVIPIEQAEADEAVVRFAEGVLPGRFVREPGSDLPAGARPLAAGCVIDPAAGAILASIGATTVRVHRRPRIMVLPTGAELVPPDRVPGPAQIRESNSLAIAWMCRAAGADVTVLPIAPDDPDPLRELIERGLSSDLLITSAGVSVGERDHVRSVLTELGVENHFWGIDLKPGKPTALGTRGESRILSLPGNPASSLVVLILLGLPAVRALAGRTDGDERREVATAGGTWPRPEGRMHAVRCALTSGGVGAIATPTGDQGSHRITSVLGADALALIDPGVAVMAGDRVRILRLA